MTQQVQKDEMSSLGFVPVSSYEHYFLNNLPIFIKHPNGQTGPVPASVELFLQGRNRKLYLIGLDPGNSGAKYAMYSPDGRIVTSYLPTVIVNAQELATGQPVTTYHQLSPSQNGDEGQDTQEILLPGDWIGQDAIGRGGVSLPTGSTRERVNDPRYAPFIMKGLIELFMKAGYPPGEYDLIGCWGARMEEVKETANGSLLDPQTKEAIDKHFLSRPWQFRRVDQWGRETDWSFTFHDIVPGPQSFAGFHLWYKRPDGLPAQDVVHGVVELDFGAFDLHRLFIECQPNMPVSATRDRVGNGMVIELIQPFARRLKEEYGVEIDDAMAFQWFISKQARVGGFAEDVSHIVAEIQARQIPAIITRAFSGAQRATDFYRLKGGGVIQMLDELKRKMSDLRRRSQTYLIVTDPTENAAGLLSILDLMVRGAARK